MAKEKFIVEASKVNPTKFGILIPKIDSGKLSVDTVYKEIKDELWKQKQIVESQKLQLAFSTANAMNEQLCLLEGDCRKIALQELKPNSVDLVFTDPPYDKRVTAFIQRFSRLL